MKSYDELKQEFSHLEKVRNSHNKRMKRYRRFILVDNNAVLLTRTRRKLDGIERRQRRLGYQLYRIIISK